MSCSRLYAKWYSKKIATIQDCGQIKVKLTFEPAWTKDMMSEDAKLALGF